MKSEDDVSQFDTRFTKQIPVDSPDDNMLSESANQIFLVENIFHHVFEYDGFCVQGFTYVAPTIIQEMTRSNGYRSPRKIFASDSNEMIDYFDEMNMDLKSNTSAVKSVKSSTLNRHHWTKPKSPGMSSKKKKKNPFPLFDH